VQTLVDVLDRFQQWRDNLPTSLANSATAEALETVLELRGHTEEVQALLPRRYREMWWSMRYRVRARVAAACCAPLGEDVTEVLDYVPGMFCVTRRVRPKLSCRSCEAIAQAPAPSLPIHRGLAGPGLLAHVLVAKCCDHLTLYRRVEIYARAEIKLDRSTLADWVGQTAPLMRRWSRR
jgi:transposase